MESTLSKPTTNQSQLKTKFSQRKTIVTANQRKDSEMFTLNLGQGEQKQVDKDIYEHF